MQCPVPLAKNLIDDSKLFFETLAIIKENQCKDLTLTLFFTVLFLDWKIVSKNGFIQLE